MLLLDADVTNELGRATRPDITGCTVTSVTVYRITRKRCTINRGCDVSPRPCGLLHDP